MSTPEMILFDYGGTLMYETDFNTLRGNAAIFDVIKDNPRGITVEEYDEYAQTLFNEIMALRGKFIEIHEYHFLRYLLEHFGITLTVPIEEAELLITEAISRKAKTPGIDSLLAFLREKGIRTGIISNLCWSGNSLKRRIAENFPEHSFEFIMTSSDYVFRKPDPHLFELAVIKSGLSADKIWYCGNDIGADIFGAKNAGLFPVFYDDKSVPKSEKVDNEGYTIDFP